jgi:hypothetical protein
MDTVYGDRTKASMVLVEREDLYLGCFRQQSLPLSSAYAKTIT